MKFMKYIGIFITLTVICISLLTMNVNATPPRYINLKYNTNTDTLKVTVFHFSPIRSFHYIYRVIVEKNGVLEQSHFYSKQPSFLANRFEYIISASPGDKLTVSAFCILFGYNTFSITV